MEALNKAILDLLSFAGAGMSVEIGSCCAVPGLLVTSIS